ncbi:MAG: alanine racemase, partial [Candidatus Cloacimonetes bacterium]|nr:alanine racemase [Candidatus Cloacimonadota bacterium]
IRFSDSLINGFYKVSTTLKFEKVLYADYFIVACTTSEEILRRYFRRNDVEYRWLLDNAIQLDNESFVVSSVKINDIALGTEIRFVDDCLEVVCTHPKLADLVGKPVNFSINTNTLYSKASHQLSVFITELTRGVQIAFHYPDELSKVQCVPVFSGQDKNPSVTFGDNSIEINSQTDEWIFPISGVVFAY